MVHSAGTGGGGPVILRSVFGGADGWKGPYEVMVTAHDARWQGNTHNCEDPFLWQDRRGNFHALFHHYGGNGNVWVGKHSCNPLTNTRNNSFECVATVTVSWCATFDIILLTVLYLLMGALETA